MINMYPGNMLFVHFCMFIKTENGKWFSKEQTCIASKESEIIGPQYRLDLGENPCHSATVC